MLVMLTTHSFQLPLPLPNTVANEREKAMAGCSASCSRRTNGTDKISGKVWLPHLVISSSPFWRNLAGTAKNARKGRDIWNAVMLTSPESGWLPYAGGKNRGEREKERERGGVWRRAQTVTLSESSSELKCSKPPVAGWKMTRK